jgi:hypothetical protein
MARKPAETNEQKLASFWKTQINLCDKENRKWVKRGEKICKQYRSEYGEDRRDMRQFALFWANVETLKPVVYAKTPVPICERRFLDKDTTGRVAATILERALRYEVAMSGFDRSVRMCRDDWLLPGRGQVWIRYNPKFEEPISPKQNADDEIISEGSGEVMDERENLNAEAEQQKMLSESLCVDYLHWKDYYTFPSTARTEDEIEGKGRRVLMSRTDLIEAFGEKQGNKIPLDYVPKTEGKDRAQTVSGQQGLQAEIYEIWWKPERKVYFVSKSYDEICKEVDDPLKLEGFFPCPPPLVATMTSDTVLPVADFIESQDQYIQINDLTRRIDILTGACKVVGVYNSAAQSLKRLFEEAQEPNLIPVDSWAMFAESGGLKGSIDWVPIESIAKTLQLLIEVRSKIMEDLDRTTGIADIMRGTTDARETMGAQRLKSNNSMNRVQDKQDTMARFCRDIINIMGEIISEHYSPETLLQVSGAMYDEGLDPPAPPPPPMPTAQPQPAMPQQQPQPVPQVA